MKCIACKRRLLKYLQLLLSDVFIVTVLLLTPQNNCKYFKTKKAEKSPKKQIVNSATSWNVYKVTLKNKWCKTKNMYMQLHKLCSQLRASFLIWFHFRSSYMIYFIYICHIHLLHGNIWTHNWPVPNISDFTAQLVGASPRYREVEGSNSIDVLNFFQVSSYTQWMIFQ